MKQTTTQQVKKAPNPEGKGGFQDHPENRNPGGWDPKNTFTYCLNYFKSLTIKEFNEWPDKHPENERTMAQQLAYFRVKSAEDLKEYQEVANRTEGMPKQTLDFTDRTDTVTSDKFKEIDDKLSLVANSKTSSNTG